MQETNSKRKREKQRKKIPTERERERERERVIITFARHIQGTYLTSYLR